MTPSETALTRTPREAYSIASERLAATSPPLVRAGSAEGRCCPAWSTRVVEMFTTCPLRRVDHLRDRQLGDVEEPGQVHGGDRSVVLDGVIRERLADVDTGVVDQRVDPPEAIESLVDRALRGRRRRRCRPRWSTKSRSSAAAATCDADDRVPGVTVTGHEARADALRGAGDDRDRR